MTRTVLVTLIAASLGLALVPGSAGFAQSPAADVIYVPTPQPVVEAMLELAGVKESDVV